MARPQAFLKSVFKIRMQNHLKERRTVQLENDQEYDETGSIGITYELLGFNK